MKGTRNGNIRPISTTVQLIGLICLFNISLSRAVRRTASFDQPVNSNKGLGGSQRQPASSSTIIKSPAPAPIILRPTASATPPSYFVFNKPTTAATNPPNVFNLQLPNWCDTKPCLNLGECTTTTDTYVSVCAAGFYGDRCEFDAIQCVNSPCLNNGLCIKSSTSTNGYSCQCLAGFVGTVCESQASQLPVPSAVRPDSSGIVDTLVAGVAVPLATTPPPTTYVDMIGGYLGLTIIVCAIVIVTAFVCTVETERKFLVDQYKMITEVGYQADFPQIDFFTVAGRRVRNGARTLCCCSKGMEDVKVPLLGSRIPVPLTAPTASMQLAPMR